MINSQVGKTKRNPRLNDDIDMEDLESVETVQTIFQSYQNHNESDHNSKKSKHIQRHHHQQLERVAYDL